MKNESSLMNKAFKNYRWVTTGIMLLGILIFVTVAYLMTESVGKVVILTQGAEAVVVAVAVVGRVPVEVRENLRPKFRTL